MEKVSKEYEKFLNWCEDKWALDYKWKKLLSKLSNDDIDFLENQYENRLKTDMIAMLTELQLEIEEIKMGDNVPFGFEPINKFYEGVSASSRVIQQKIDKLKEQTDGNKREND